MKWHLPLISKYSRAPARLGSLAAAAVELHVTIGAVASLKVVIV